MGLTVNPPGSFLERVLGLFGRRPSSAPLQRRHYMRIPTEAHELKCWYGREYFKGVMLDVSIAGMRVYLSHAVVPGMPVTIRLQSTEEYAEDTLHCRIAWCRPDVSRFEVGLAFADDADVLGCSWLPDVIKRAQCARCKDDERRGSARISTRVEVGLRSAFVRCKAVVLDISEGGALIHSPKPLDDGAYVHLTGHRTGHVPGLDIEARVLRSRPTIDGTYRVSLQFVVLSTADHEGLQQNLQLLARQAA